MRRVSEDLRWEDVGRVSEDDGVGGCEENLGGYEGEEIGIIIYCRKKMFQ